MSIKRSLKTTFILGILYVGAFNAVAEEAAEEEAVSFGDTATASAPKFNPYTFERNKYWIALPIGMLALLSLHLIAYPYIRVKKQKITLESKRNET